MKKVKLLLLTLLAVVVHSTAWSQDYVKVGTHYNGRNTAAPVYSSSTYGACSESETVYTAEELAAAGIQAGDKIYSIKYRGYNIGDERTAAFNVYMENTTASSPHYTAVTFNSTGMTQVYNGNVTILQVGSNGTKEENFGDMVLFDLDTPFEYTGGNIRYRVHSYNAAPLGVGISFDPSTVKNTKVRYADNQTAIESVTSFSSPYNPIIYLKITPNSDYQVKLTNSSIPTEAVVNESVTFSYTIENKGVALTTDNYTVKFYANSQLVETATSVAIDANGSHTFTFNYTPTTLGTYPVYAEITFADETVFRTPQSMITVGDGNEHWSWTVNDNTWPNGVFYNAWQMSNNIIHLASTNQYYLEPTAKTGAIFITPKLHFEAGEQFIFDAAKYYGTVNDYTPNLTVSVSKDNRQTWETVMTLDESQFGGAQLGGSTSMIYAFVQRNFNITESGDYYIMFSGAARLDNFYGGTLVDQAHDVMITATNLPSTGEVNSDITAEITVKNLLNNSDKATAKYYINNTLVAEAAEKNLTTQSNITFSMIGKPYEAGTFTSYAEIILEDGTIITSSEQTINIAQEVAKGELTVGSYNNYASSFPIATSSTGSFSDMIWKAADLASAGLTAGTKIKGVVFKGYNTASEMTVPVKFWFGNTEVSTQVTGSDPTDDLTNTTDLTKVYDGNYTIAKAGSYGEAGQVDIMTINFATPIEYTGNNIRIHAQCLQDAAQSSVNFAYTSTRGTSYKSYTSWSGRYSGNDTQYLPWVTFLYEKEISYFSGKATIERVGGTIEPIANATVKLTAEDGTAYMGQTDAEGNFNFAVMQDNKTYDITIDYSAANCFPMDLTVTFNGTSVTKNIEFVEGVDFLITASDVPTEGRINNTYTATVNATNYNMTTLAASDYTAKLFINDVEVAQAEKSDIASMESKTFTFSYVPTTKGTVTAYIQLAGPMRTVTTEPVNVTFDTDFYEVSSNTPATAMTNNRYTASVTVKNHKPTTLLANDYTAKFYLNGEVSEELTTEDIEGMGEKTLTFGFMPHEVGTYTAKIVITSPTETITKDDYTITVVQETGGGELTILDKKSDSNEIPLNFYYKHSITETVYSKAELEKYGLKAGQKILDLALLSYKQTSENKTVHVQMYLENTTDNGSTKKSMPYTSNMTKIYDKTSTLEAHGTSTEYAPFYKADMSENPFVYTGDNLRLVIFHDATQYESSGNKTKFKVDNAQGKSYNHKNDNTDAQELNTSSTNYSPVLVITTPGSMHYIGVTKDESNAVVSGATVTLTNAENDVIYSGTSDSEGNFDIEVVQHELPYIVTASKDALTYTGATAVEFNGANIENEVIILKAAPQEEEVVVLNGASTTATTGVPFIFTKKHSQSETIYPASEIALEQGSKITKIEYKSLNVDTKEFNTRVRIWLENTNDAPNTLPQDHKEQSMTLVYDGNINVTSHGNYVGYNNPANEYERFFSFTLDTPFEYDGTSNLRLVISQDGNDTSTNGTNTPRVLTDNTKNYSYVKSDNGIWGNPGTDEWDSTNLFWKGNYGTKASPVLFLTYILEQTAANELTLDEDVTWTPVAETFTKVTLKRTFQTGYNTVCLPFDIDNETFKAKFGNDAEVYRFVDYYENNIYFQKMTTPSLTANNAFVVKLTTAPTEIVFENVTTSADGIQVTDNYGVKFMGSYNSHTDLDGAAGDYGIRPDGHIQKAGSGAFIRGFRAYLNTNNTSGALQITFADETTGISETFGDINSLSNEQWHTIDGQLITTPTKQGVYIKNGKKVVIK